jgi:hypothetical protein
LPRLREAAQPYPLGDQQAAAGQPPGDDDPREQPRADPSGQQQHRAKRDLHRSEHDAAKGPSASEPPLGGEPTQDAQQYQCPADDRHHTGRQCQPGATARTECQGKVSATSPRNAVSLLAITAWLTGCLPSVGS